MLSKLLKRFTKLPVYAQKDYMRYNKNSNENNQGNKKPAIYYVNISTKIDKNKIFFKQVFENSSDVTFYEFESALKKKGMLVYISGLENQEVLNRDVVNQFITKVNSEIDIKNLKSILSVSKIREAQKVDIIIDNLLDGNAILFVEGLNTAIIIEAVSFEERGIETPDTENVLRGPKEGFNEDIKVNMTLIRRKIRNEKLVFETLKIGRQTKTLVAIAYIKGLVENSILNELKLRLDRIETDSILETGYIEQFIEDAPYSLHSTIGNTQKPDVIAAKLLEGRIAILCDGTPFVLTIPYLLIECIQTSEDYYVRPFIVCLLRSIRVIAIFVGIFFPAIYVALQTYHQEMIPTELLLRMTETMEAVPYPAAAEAFIMVLAFELLRESSTRLTKTVGSAVSIVGGLIIGDAAVKAGISSPIMVVVIATCAVASFINPSLNEVITVYRYVMLLLSAMMGVYGITCGVFMILIHLTSLRSFGIPYTAPLSPLKLSGMKDFIIRFPLNNMNNKSQLVVESRRNNQRRSYDNSEYNER